MKKNNGFRKTSSKDGSLTPHLYDPIATHIRNYCEQQNISVSKFVEDCIKKQMDVLEKEAYNNMPKEMLIELLLAKKETRE